MTGTYLNINVHGSGFRSYVLLSRTDKKATLFDLHRLETIGVRIEHFTETCARPGPTPGFNALATAGRLERGIADARRHGRKFCEEDAAAALRMMRLLAGPPY